MFLQTSSENQSGVLKTQTGLKIDSKNWTGLKSGFKTRTSSELVSRTEPVWKLIPNLKLVLGLVSKTKSEGNIKILFLYSSVDKRKL